MQTLLVTCLLFSGIFSLVCICVDFNTELIISGIQVIRAEYSSNSIYCKRRLEFGYTPTDGNITWRQYISHSDGSTLAVTL